MSNIIPFEFNGAKVRVINKEGEPWFVAKDVAELLGYAKPENAISRHCKAGITTPKQGGGLVTIIPERDLYRLIMRSKLPAAEQFEEWVVGTVLPSIRKHGGYIANQESISAEEIMANGLIAAQSVIAEKQATIESQHAQIIEFQPKIEAFDRLSGADGSVCITNAAKDLQLRPKDLFAYLSEKKWIYKRQGNSSWTAYQDRIQQGVLEHKTTTVNRSDGSEKVTEQVRVTAKGLVRLAKVFTEGRAA